MKGAEELKAVLIEESENDFKNSITGDQSWFYLSCEPKWKMSISIDDVPKKVSKPIHTQKVMITFMFTKHYR